MCLLDDDSVIMNGDLITWEVSGIELDEFCSDGYDLAEAHARWVAQAWGTDPIEFDYGVFESRDHPCWPCHDKAGACVLDGIVAATEVPHRHEIAHAVRAGSCHPLIEEGWAMLYGDHFHDAKTGGDIRLVLADTNHVLAAEHYPIAARFVAFLLETRGTARLRLLCNADARGPEELESAVLATYGITFEDLAAEFDAYPEYPLAELRQDEACEGDDVLVVPTEWDFSMECGAPGVEGRPDVALQTQRLVRLYPGFHDFLFESTADADVRLELRNCERDGMASVYHYFTSFHLEADTPFYPMILDPPPPGKYVLRVRLDEPTRATTLHVSI